MLNSQQKRLRKHRRIRAKIFGTAKVPRLCVFRSNQHIYAQLIDDEKGRVLLSASDLNLKVKKTKAGKETNKSKDQTGKKNSAFEVGKALAQKTEEKKIKKVVFDRGGYKYHGRVKALAEGAREGGLKF